MPELRTRHISFLILLFGIIFYIPFLGKVNLFDWDEINFAESAREMIISGNYLDVQINFQAFWEKPPLFIWLQVLSMKIFGVNEFAARFPNAVCGMISLFMIFITGKRFRDQKFAVLWMLSFGASVLPFLYFKSGIIDPWFNLFIFSGLVYFARYFSDPFNKRKNLVVSGFFIGLAVLTKGPAALLILIISFVAFLIVKKIRIQTGIVDVMLYTFVIAFTGGFWFILLILNGNMDIIRDFIDYQIRLFSTKDAGHGGFFLYHFVVLLIGVFPASLFAIPGFFTRVTSRSDSRDFRIWMLILFWTVLILFTIVKTKIIHYSSLCYFPLSFFSALYLYRCLEKDQKFPVVLKSSIWVMALLFTIMTIAVSFLDKYRSTVIAAGWIKDPFAAANLMSDIKLTGIESLPGILFFILILFFLFNRSFSMEINIYGIFSSVVLFVYSVMIFIVPEIEACSQRAAVDFYKSVSREDVYISTLGYKSYAHLFYGKIKPGADPRSEDRQWLIEGVADKPVYIVYKINRKERYIKQYPMLKILYEKNGFVFTKRE